MVLDLIRPIGLLAASITLWLAVPKYADRWLSSFALLTALSGSCLAIRESDRYGVTESRRRRQRVTDEDIYDLGLVFRQAMKEAQLQGYLSAYQQQFQPSVNVNGDGAIAPTADAPNAIAPKDIPSALASYDGHVLIASRTGSGKTTLIQAAIAAKHNHHNGLVDFHIIDPKGGSWCDLQHDQDYFFCNSSDKIPELLSRLAVIEGLLESRQHQRIKQGGHWQTPPMPVVVIVDEFNTLKALCSKEQANVLTRIIQRIIFQGREDCVHLWLMAQTTRVQQLGLDTSVQDNLAFLALARCGNYQSIEDAIGNNYVVSNANERRELQALLMGDKRSPRDKNQPLVFTTFGGNGLCLLPDLSHAKHIRLNRSVVNEGNWEGAIAPTVIQSSPNPIPVTNPYEMAERMWNAPMPSTEVHDGELVDDSPSIDWEKLPKILHPLVEYSLKNGWVSASQIMQNVRFYKLMDGCNSEQIRLFFQQCINYGVGCIEGEAEKMRFNAKR